MAPRVVVGAPCLRVPRVHVRVAALAQQPKPLSFVDDVWHDARTVTVVYRGRRPGVSSVIY